MSSEFGDLNRSNTEIRATEVAPTHEENLGVPLSMQSGIVRNCEFVTLNPEQVADIS
jgi:hypothetical protein